MSTKPSSDLARLFKLNIEFKPEEGVTIQTTRNSDEARGQRQIVVKKTWKRVKEIGRGGFGVVWLESTGGISSELRAVKEIGKNAGYHLGKIDYNQELEALALLSKVRCVLSY